MKMIKYFCDKCGTELSSSDPISFMLDMIGKVFCWKHLKEYNEYKEGRTRYWNKYDDGSNKRITLS
jgi:hypothetical protein